MKLNANSLKRRIADALWGLCKRIQDDAQRYTCLMEPLSELTEPGETPLLGVMAAIWMFTPEFQGHFDLASRVGRRDFLAWCFSTGLRNFAILREALLHGPGREHYFRPSGLTAHFPGGDVVVPYAIEVAHGIDLNGSLPNDPRSDAAARQMLKFYCEHLDEFYGGADLLPEWFVADLRQAGPACAAEFPFLDRPAGKSADSPAIAPAPRSERRRGGVNVVGISMLNSGSERMSAAPLRRFRRQALSMCSSTVRSAKIFRWPPRNSMRQLSMRHFSPPICCS